MMIFGGVEAGGTDEVVVEGGNGREPDGTGQLGPGVPDGKGGRGMAGGRRARWQLLGMVVKWMVG